MRKSYQYDFYRPVKQRWVAKSRIPSSITSNNVNDRTEFID